MQPVLGLLNGGFVLLIRARHRPERRPAEGGRADIALTEHRIAPAAVVVGVVSEPSQTPGNGGAGRIRGTRSQRGTRNAKLLHQRQRADGRRRR